MTKRASKRARTEPAATPPSPTAAPSPTAILLGGNALPAAMVSQYRCGQFCDVTIVVEDERFLVQRSVLAGGSEYFRGLLLGGGSYMAGGGASSPTLTLEEMSASTVRLVLEWLYTGQCVVEHTALLDLLAAAGRLRVEPLQEAATWSIIGNVLTDATCLDIWDAARRLAEPELESAARRFALEHFEAVTPSPGSLPSDILAEMLISDDLTCSREEQVLDVLVRWARIHQPSAAALAELLQHVRFDRFADASSAQRMLTEPLFLSRPCLIVIATKLAAQLDPARERSPSRKAPLERSDPDSPDAIEALMRKVYMINKAAAEFAYAVEKGSHTSQLVGPLLMFLQVRKGFLSQASEAKLENTLASGFLKVATATLPDRWPSVTIHDVRDAAVYDAEEVATHRPPARELERYLRHQVLLPDTDKAARLVWLDEVVDFNDSQLSSASVATGLTVERLRALIEGVLRDKFHSAGTLVCTHDLPSAIIAQLLQHVQQHEAATHAQKGPSGSAAAAPPVPHLAAIVMPCQVIRFNVSAFD